MGLDKLAAIFNNLIKLLVVNQNFTKIKNYRFNPIQSSSIQYQSNINPISIQFNPIQSNSIQFNPIQSNSIQFNPIQSSVNSSEELNGVYGYFCSFMLTYKCHYPSFRKRLHIRRRKRKPSFFCFLFLFFSH